MFVIIHLFYTIDSRQRCTAAGYFRQGGTVQAGHDGNPPLGGHSVLCSPGVHSH